MSLWNLRNYEIFVHRGYYGDNSIAGFEACAEKGFYIESDCVQNADGTLFISHDRSTTDADGNTVYVANMTDEEFRTYWPDAPTMDDFITFMQEHPTMLVNIDLYTGAVDALKKMSDGGILDRIIINTGLDSAVSYAANYPELSYCILTAANPITEDSELDGCRTPHNIVCCEGSDNPDGKISAVKLYSASWTETYLADAISNGVTWFCCPGSAADDIAEWLKDYTAPGYAQSYMLTNIGDAIRSKNGTSGTIAARNYPSQIRKLKTLAEDVKVDALNVKMVANTQAPWFKGYTAVGQINIDVKGCTGSPGVSYAAMDGAYGGKISVTNCANASLGSDWLRSSYNISEIDFVGGIYPSGTITRFGQQFGSSTEFSAFLSQNFTEVTVRGIHLDNVTGFNALAENAAIPFNIIWEGMLNSSVTFTNKTKLTAASVNSLIGCLADYSAGDAHTLTLDSDMLAMVTEESMEIAAARNWTVA